MSAASASPVAIVYRCGPFELAVEEYKLTGPLGVMFIRGRPSALLVRLMRRPGVVAAHSDLICTVWPESNQEPEDAQAGLRHAVWWTRRMLAMLSAGTGAPTIENVLEVGYVMREGSSAKARDRSTATPAD